MKPVVIKTTNSSVSLHLFKTPECAGLYSEAAEIGIREGGEFRLGTTARLDREATVLLRDALNVLLGEYTSGKDAA